MALATADDIPVALLPSILQHVPLKQRLASCALVCKAWAPAAAAATSQISMSVRRCSSSDSNLMGDSDSPHAITVRQPMDSCLEVFGCSGWLQQHGSNLKSLRLEYVDPKRCYIETRARFRLPCAALAQLTSLSIAGCMVSITPPPPQQLQQQQQQQQQQQNGSSFPALPQLVDLKFRSCNFSSSAVYQQLVSSAALTALDLQLVCCNDRPMPYSKAAADMDPPSTELEAALRACTGLRSLTMQYWRSFVSMPLSSLVAVSTLQHLQQLDVDLPYTGSAAPSVLPHFPTSLTGLWLNSITYDFHVLPRQVRDLRDLVVLRLEQLFFEPRVLTSLSKLQSLKLNRCISVPDAADRNRPLAALLAAVGTLTQLTQLVVTTELVGRDEMRQLQAPPHAFAALTAASQLRVLQFQVLSDTDDALPGFADALRHMFPPGRWLWQLHTLKLGVCYTGDSASKSCIEWNVPPADLAAVANSCPGLRTLSLVGVLQHADTRPLLQFRTVRNLCLGGRVLDVHAAAVVANMTQLTRLDLLFTRTHGFCARGFAHVVASTQLQHLGLHGVKVDSISLRGGVELTLPQELTASYQDGPPWLQLAGLLKDCAPVWRAAQQNLWRDYAGVVDLCSRVTQLKSQLRLAQPARP